MGSRCLIAKVERNGSGRYITLNHGGTPDNAGRTLLEHYRHEENINRLLEHGDTGHIDPNPDKVKGHHITNEEPWENCRPKEFDGGTQTLFGATYMLVPEWIYCWTPDGWAATKVLISGIPQNFFENLRVMTPMQFQDWYDHNQEPEWTKWRIRCQEEQIPRSLHEIIRNYEESRKPALSDLISR